MIDPPPSPDRARDLLARELAGPDYPHPSLLERAWQWITEQWANLSASAGGSTVGLLLAVVVAAVLAVALLALVSRVRRDPAAPLAPVGVLDVPASADELRRRAEEALAAGQAPEAVAQATRALARRGVERGLLDDAPGRTTHEVFAELGARFPDHVTGLRGAADLFDRVVYGRRRPEPAQAQAVLDLEDTVRRTPPSQHVAGTGPLAVPR